MDSGSTKTRAAAVLAAALVAAFVLIAATGGLSSPSVPEGDIAFVEDVDDGAITQEELDRALEQVAVTQGLEAVPEDEEQLGPLRDAAISDLILTRWIYGEAEDRGIEVTEGEIEQEREQIVEQQFGDEDEFREFLEQARLTEEEADDRIELTLLSERIQEEELPTEPEIDEREIEVFYEQNVEQFTVDEQRSIRVALNPEQEEAERAFELLSEDDSNRSWNRVTEELSTDEATQDRGGLLENVTEVAAPTPEVGERAFEAQEGELVEPFETDLGWYVIQVIEVTPEETTPLEEAEESIRGQLGSIEQQRIAQAFEQEFVQGWIARTACDDEYLVPRCHNFEPDEQDVALPEGGALVQPSAPVEPGEAGVIGGIEAVGRPQGPLQPESEMPVTEDLPVPVGPDGAPVIPE